jgi:hypothetical protein
MRHIPRDPLPMLYMRCTGAGVTASGQRLQRYTAFIAFAPDGEPSEEIDVDAVDERDARRLAQVALDRDYEPGGTIVRVVGPREGMYS